MTVLATIDWIIIFAYFSLILGIAWWVIKQKQDTSDDYFLAGRNLGDETILVSGNSGYNTGSGYLTATFAREREWSFSAKYSF